MVFRKTFTFLVDNKKSVFFLISTSSFLISSCSHFWADDLNSSGILTPRPTIGPHLKYIVKETLQDFASIHPENHDQKLFKAHGGAHVHHYGINTQFTKSTILIPDFFNITSFDQINSNIINQIIQFEYGIVIPDEAWNSSHAKKLIESFLLSTNAKKYAIAHQLYTNNLIDTVLKSMTLGLCCVIFFRFMSIVYMKKISHLKLLFGTILSISFFFSMYILNTHFISFIIDMKALSLTVTKGRQNYKDIKKNHFMIIDDEYFKGAKEYYSKLRDRNLAIKHLFPEYKYLFLKIDQEGNMYNIFKYTQQPEVFLSLLSNLVSNSS